MRLILPVVAWLVAFPTLLPAADDTGREDDFTQRRLLFFQANFDKFVSVRFEKTTNVFAVIQYLKVKENTFDFDGSHYCGFKFTVPDWIDGDFEWLNVLAKTEMQKDFTIPAHHFRWYIVPEQGTCDGFKYFQHGEVARSEYLKQHFPYTRRFLFQTLEQESLKPGAMYAIWFQFDAADMPDIGFVLTIDSERGHREFGKFPPSH